jgi:hypothetical protein
MQYIWSPVEIGQDRFVAFGRNAGKLPAVL